LWVAATCSTQQQLIASANPSVDIAQSICRPCRLYLEQVGQLDMSCRMDVC
jgi:hypothetical protein